MLWISNDITSQQKYVTPKGIIEHMPFNSTQIHWQQIRIYVKPSHFIPDEQRERQVIIDKAVS